MNIDRLGQTHLSENELARELYKNPALDLSLFLVDQPIKFNVSNKQLHAGYKALTGYVLKDIDVEKFDQANQSNWFMPDEYKTLDIVQYVLDQCRSDAELQRAGEELIMYVERDLLDMLRYLKYLVDTLRKNNVVWGVGRGSSVASFVLFLLGVHRVNSLYFGLPVEEFLK